MRGKRLTWSGKSLVIALLLLAGLCFSTDMYAQSLSSTPTGTWYDESTAISRLTQELQTLEAYLQTPPATPSFAFIKSQRWYYQEILSSLRAGETVPKSVEIGQQKVGGVMKSDAPNPDLTAKEMTDLFQSAITLLKY